MEEELREKIAVILDNHVECFQYEYDQDKTINTVTDSILTLIREAGYEPPESLREMVEKSYADGVDDTEQKYKGYMSPEMVKGLIFEVQAKKCANCPKKQEAK